MVHLLPRSRIIPLLLTGATLLALEASVPPASCHAQDQLPMASPAAVTTPESGQNGPGTLRTDGAASQDSRLATDLVEGGPNGRHLAPPDTFYLLKYVSVRTDKGVDGFLPGQEVRLVEVHRPTQTLVVTDGHSQVEVSPTELTNDRNIAAMAQQKDQAKQSQVAAYMQAQQEAYSKYQRAAAEYTAQDVAKREEKQKELVEEVRAAREARRQEQQAAARPVNADAGNAGYGYYDYGNEGYGSPFAYFAGVSAGNAASAAPAKAAPAAPAPAPNNVAAPAATGAAGRPK